jgi:hypothetical protein
MLFLFKDTTHLIEHIEHSICETPKEKLQLKIGRKFGHTSVVTSAIGKYDAFNETGPPVTPKL